jgi:serine/threonine-protein kinase RsbW
MPSALKHVGPKRSRASVRLQAALQSDMGCANEAASILIRFARKHRFGRQKCHEIELAVREAVANAVLHGNGCDPGKKVFLNAAVRPSGLVICVRDEGKGFDPEAVPDPLVSGNLLQESGRGLFLVKAYMDKVIWKPAPQGGMETWLTKYFARRL